jgi:hypothetical protein
VKISYDSTSKNCTQTDGNNVKNDYVNVPGGYAIHWETPSLNFEIKFKSTDPFYDYIATSGSVDSGATSAPKGTKSSYDSVTIGGNSCQNAGQLGIVMQ